METLPLTWRPLTVADAPALARLWAAVEVVEETGEHYDADDVAEELGDPSVDLTRDTVGVLGPDGEFVAWGGLRGSSSEVGDVHRVWADASVLPSARGRGIGRELLRRQRDRARELHASRHPSLPGQFCVMAYSHLDGKLALLRSGGFTEVRWWYDMQRDLTAPLPAAVPVPDGLRLVPWTPDLDERTRLAHGDAFAGHWGSTAPDRTRWAHWYTGAQAFRPADSLLVLDGDEVAGYLLTYYYTADHEATGVREAWVGQLGVRPGWRQRGLGTLLLGSALRHYADAGYARSGLNVDTGNATGALGLYQRLGYEVTRPSVTWAVPLG
jgi:mycothiol synthase